MKIIAITGSIAVGKSVVSKLINDLGYSVFDADKCVKRQYLFNYNMISKIKEQFPQIVVNNRIDKNLLKDKIFSNHEARKKLENIVHPIVRAKFKKFISKSALNGQEIVFADIPLLYETGWDKYCEYVVNIKTNIDTQLNRVIKRDNMSIELFEKIKKSQLDMDEKSNRADFIISNNNKTIKNLKIDVINIIEMIS